MFLIIFLCIIIPCVFLVSLLKWYVLKKANTYGTPISETQKNKLREYKDLMAHILVIAIETLHNTHVPSHKERVKMNKYLDDKNK